MHLKAEINLDNNSFQNGGTNELKRAINESLEELRGQWPNVNGARSKVRDCNGNIVGTITILDD